MSGSTVTCGALRDAAALVAATDGLEPSAPAEEEAWSSTPLEEAALRAAALVGALEGRSVVADDGTRAEARTVTWVVVGQDSAPDAAVAWQPAVQPASGDARDLLAEDGAGAQGWWSSPEAQRPAADPGRTVTPPSDQGDEQQPAETPRQTGSVDPPQGAPAPARRTRPSSRPRRSGSRRPPCGTKRFSLEKIRVS